MLYRKINSSSHSTLRQIMSLALLVALGAALVSGCGGPPPSNAADLNNDRKMKPPDPPDAPPVK